MKMGLLWIILLMIVAKTFGQSAHYTTGNAHSHNDYEQALPFYDAYARHFGSIEADVWAVNGKLMVAHSQDEVKEGRTFENLYLKPLLHRLKINHGKAYQNGQQLQLLIDLKSSYSEVLPVLKRLLQPCYHYFDREHNPNAVRLVISGNMPPPDSLHYFDTIFTFDGRIGTTYPKEDIQRVVLVSDNVQKFVKWSKSQPLDAAGFRTLQHLVDSLHRKNKLIRFWATPNTLSAYQILMKLGVDYIGSDNLRMMEDLLTKKKNLSLHFNRVKFHE